MSRVKAGPNISNICVFSVCMKRYDGRTKPIPKPRPAVKGKKGKPSVSLWVGEMSGLDGTNLNTSLSLTKTKLTINMGLPMFVLMWRGREENIQNFTVFGFVLNNTFLFRIPKYRQQLNPMCPPSLCV